jgi:hypothetical protein
MALKTDIANSIKRWRAIARKCSFLAPHFKLASKSRRKLIPLAKTMNNSQLRKMKCPGIEPDSAADL